MGNTGIIQMLTNMLFNNSPEDKAPVKDLDYLAIHYPYEYNTVCGVYNILENDIDETEKCLLFSQWLLFDPVWMAERTKSDIIDTVVDFYNTIDMDKLIELSKTFPVYGFSDVSALVGILMVKIIDNPAYQSSRLLIS